MRFRAPLWATAFALATLAGCATGVGTCCRSTDGTLSDCVSSRHRSQRAWLRGNACSDGRAPAGWCPADCAWTAHPAGGPPGCSCPGEAAAPAPPAQRSAAPPQPGVPAGPALVCCSSGEVTDAGTELFDCTVLDASVPGARTKCVQSGKTYKDCEDARCSAGRCVCSN